MCAHFVKLCEVHNEGVSISDEKILLTRFHVFQISRLGILEITDIPHHQPIQEINSKRIFQRRFASKFFE